MSGSARTIIRHLANGVDPMTGEALPLAAPYNHPEIIRALFGVLEELDGFEAQQKSIPRNLPERHGKPWSPKEKQQTVKDFKSGVPMEEIAAKLDRKKSAVWSMLEHQGLLEPLPYKRFKPPHPTPSSLSAPTV